MAKFTFSLWNTRSFFLLLFLLFFLPHSAFAYIGPGAGLSAIGAFLAVVAGIIVAIFGFLWYPIKRLLRKKKRKHNKQGEGAE